MKSKVLGEQNYNNKGRLMKIVEYNNDDNIIVKFVSTGNKVCCTYQQFRKGTVRNKS